MTNESEISSEELISFCLYEVCEYLNKDRASHKKAGNVWSLDPGKLETALSIAGLFVTPSAMDDFTLRTFIRKQKNILAASRNVSPSIKQRRVVSSDADRVNNRLAVVTQGGLVQAIVAERPDELSAVIIDYDAQKDGSENDSDVFLVPQLQEDGDETALAFVRGQDVDVPAIDLDAVFEFIYSDN